MVNPTELIPMPVPEGTAHTPVLLKNWTATFVNAGTIAPNVDMVVFPKLSATIVMPEPATKPIVPFVPTPPRDWSG
jgi:hypothetical protein